MGILTGYSTVSSVNDNDKYLTSDNAGATKLSSASQIKSYVLATGNVGTSALADASVTPQKMLGVDLYAIGGSYTGSAPTAGTGQFYVIAGSNVISTNSSGQGQVNFASAFPNGIISVNAINGDTAASPHTVTGTFTVSTSGFWIQLSSAVTVASYRVNWIAYGW